MKINRDIVLAAIKAIEKANPQTLADFESVIVNHAGGDRVEAIMTASILDVASCLTVADLIEIAKRSQ